MIVSELYMGRKEQDFDMARRILQGETELWTALCQGAEAEALYAARGTDANGLLPPHEYEEIAQEALGRCYDQLDRYQGRSRFIYWVRAYARHLTLNHCARQRTRMRNKRLLEAAAREQGRYSDPLCVLLRLERDRALWAAVDTLDPVDREILLGRVLYNRSPKMLGKALDLPRRQVLRQYEDAVIAVRMRFFWFYARGETEG